MDTGTLWDLINLTDLTSDQPAVIYHGMQTKKVTITYRELLEVCDIISKELVNSKDDIVAIAVKHHQHLVPAFMLGILKVNAAFFYLDWDIPKDKQEKLLDLINCHFLISDCKNYFDRWVEVAKLNLKGENVENNTIFITSKPCETKSLSSVEESWKRAYVVRTSGSTGKSKIVHVPHSCILPNLIDLKKRFGVIKDDVIVGCSPFTFDPSVIDVFLSLSCGATLVLVAAPIKSMPEKLVSIIKEERVTVMQATPSLLYLIGPELARKHLLSENSSLRVLALGGEAFPPTKTFKEYYNPRNKTTIYNIYGITEVSCWATSCLYDRRNTTVDLGHPLEETQLVVLNDDGKEIFDGTGQLYIGSSSRICLLDNEKLEDLNLPVFRKTGDIVRFHDGKIFYHGRFDDEIKRLGQRLNLHAVETLAIESGMTSQCCAFLDSNQRLILACKDIKSQYSLKEHFKHYAPVIQQPNLIFHTEYFPLSKHGKIDRRKVLDLFLKKKGSLPVASNDWLVIMANHWKDATGKDMTLEANFILSGGNSLSAIELANLIQETLRISCPRLLDVLINRSCQEVVDYIRAASKEDKGRPTNLDVQIFKGYQPSQLIPSLTNCDSIKLVWKFQLNKCIDASPLVVTRGNKAVVYIGSHSHLFSAIEVDSGKEVWTRELSDRIESSASCDVDGLEVFVGCYDGHLYCLNAENGEIRWKFLAGDAIKSSALCIKSSVVFGSHDKKLYCVSKLNGDLIWTKAISSGSLFSSPVWDHQDLILVASLDGTCCAVNLVGGEKIWTIQLEKPVFASPTCFDEYKRCLFSSVAGDVNCCDTSTGMQIWQFRASGPIFSTPKVSKNRIFFGSHDHSLYCLQADNGSQLWRVVFRSPVYSSPFVNHVVVCTDTTGLLRIMSAENGTILSETLLPGETFSSPVLVGSLVLIGCRDDFVYCLRAAENVTDM